LGRRSRISTSAITFSNWVSIPSGDDAALQARIRAIKDQLERRAGAANDASNVKAVESLSTNLSAVEESIYQVRNRRPRDTLNYPIKLNNQLGILE